MTGRVNARFEATVRLRVFGPSGQVQDLIAVVDTGYNGSLTLPMAVVNRLALTPHVTRRVRLGDGSRVVLTSYIAEIDREGTRRRITVLSAGGVPLLGTALLRGYHLEIGFADGGLVSTRPLP